MQKLPSIRHMRVFVSAVEFGSISRSAKVNNVSQPAVTKAINRLEHFVEAKLLERNTRHVDTTNCGEHFYRRLRRILEYIDEGISELTFDAALTVEPDRKMLPLSSSHVHALLALETHGSFTAAARDLGLSQPSIHRSARTLERLSGASLFTTSRQRLELTESAKRATSHFRLAVSEFRHSVDEIDHFFGRDHPVLRIGSVAGAHQHILVEALRIFGKRKQFLRFKLIEGSQEHMRRALRTAEIDVLLDTSTGDLPEAELRFEPLLRDEVCVVVDKSHASATLGLQTDAQLFESPWVVQSCQGAGSNLFLKIVENAGVSASNLRTIETSSTALIQQLMKDGFVAVVTKSQLAEGSIANAVVCGGSKRRLVLVQGLFFRISWTPTPVQARFVDILRDLFCCAE